VTRCVCEKIAQDAAQSIFLQKIAQPLPWKQAAKKYRLHLQVSKIAQSKKSPDGRKFAQSGHPDM
jgi:hypothetical protein